MPQDEARALVRAGPARGKAWPSVPPREPPREAGQAPTCTHLERDEVEDGGDGPLPAGLAVCIQGLQLLRLPELDPDLDGVPLEVLLRLAQDHLPRATHLSAWGQVHAVEQGNSS